ncbi:ABC transporter ATP-binding protein [Comamonas sp. NoAH]|uniref:ABC transporter ATP-binding protein n=1 Tax=Comamonas halotolerans TaxID=3041496 RepID=UPI0024E09977|nr:ABC transporter ATP-binding protein [Comamonas sp. NoAH]
MPRLAHAFVRSTAVAPVKPSLAQRFWQRWAAEWEGPSGSWSSDLAEPDDRLASGRSAGAVNAPESSAVSAVVTPLLQIQDVSLIYATAKQQVRATHRVSLDVHEGDRFVLLGASGCGKSSLLKALGGFIDPAEGQILLDGKAVYGPGPDRVVVFQEFDQLPPWKTVRENVMFPLLASGQLGREAARSRADAVIEKVGLAQFADAHPHQLSGGMKQRVAIARALAMQPRVLLMDEPFAALDALTRRRMQEELLALWEEFRFTLVFVTHSIEEALVVGNRIAILSPHPGRVRAEINSHQFDLSSQGSAAFQATAQRIHRLLFEPAPGVTVIPATQPMPSAVEREAEATRAPAWVSTPVSL